MINVKLLEVGKFKKNEFNQKYQMPRKSPRE